jgi:Flp pilus assembly protein TadG
MNIFLRLRRNQKAIAAIEFAIIFPVIMLLLYGVIELTRYIYFHQKVQSTSDQVSNLINQNYGLTDQSLDSVYNAAQILMEPFDGASISVIVTSFTKKTNPAIDNRIRVDWQQKRGNPGVVSKFAPNGDCGGVTERGACNVVVPPASFGVAPMVFRLRDQIIVVEVFSGYQSIFLDDYFQEIIDPAEEFYKYTIARPRYGSFLQ